MRDPLKDPKKYVTRYEVTYIAPGRAHHGSASKGFSSKKKATIHMAKLQLEGHDCYINTARYRRVAR